MSILPYAVMPLYPVLSRRSARPSPGLPMPLLHPASSHAEDVDVASVVDDVGPVDDDYEVARRR